MSEEEKLSHEEFYRQIELSNAIFQQQAKQQIEVALTGKIADMIISSGKNGPSAKKIATMMELLREFKRGPTST